VSEKLNVANYVITVTAASFSVLPNKDRRRRGVNPIMPGSQE
jgi:hypothetical protein